MSGHVPPHRWADAWAGRIAGDERAEMDRHANDCKACARARARVTRASDTFSTIRTQSSPDLSWDAVRAKVHWSVSTERRAKVRLTRRPSAAWIAFGCVAAAGVAGVLLVDRSEPVAQSAQDTPHVDGGLPHVAPAEPAKLVGLVNRTTGEVMIDGIRPDPDAVFARRLGAGSVIATGDGRVDVQFGTASGFALGAHSKLELRRFDAQAIELAIDGTVDVQVAPRTNGQRFLVHAGERTIEVRGTQFRVRHEASGATSVACRHGLVAVHDRDGQLEVGAARHVELAKARPVIGQHVTAMTADQLEVLVEATPVTMPVWDLTALGASAPLEIATAGRRDVRLDGVELGAAPLRVRVLPGRHTLDAADSAGRYRRAGWIDVAAPDATTKPARLEVHPEAPATRGVDARRRELLATLDRARLAQCTRAAVKQGITGSFYVEIEIGVDAQGTVGYVNILDTDLGSRQCLSDALHAVQLKAGAPAEWRQRIEL